MKALFWRGIPLFLLLFTCCTNVAREEIDFTFIEVDVTKNYPVKELRLEDIADIEYVSLEMHDDYLFRGRPGLITDTYFIQRGAEDDILIFSRLGKALSKFNRKGNGPGEYSYLFGNFVYNADLDELYISTSGKIQVYSLHGEHKRSLPIAEHSIIIQMVDFDDDCLLCFENYTMPTAFSLISKKDGSLVESIPIEIEEKISIYVQRRDENMVYTNGSTSNNIVRNRDSYLLTNHSSDTVYRYGKDRILEPVLARSPSVQKMDPVIYLNSYLETSAYLFLHAITVEYDWDTRRGFPTKDLFVDKKDKQIYEQKITWSDYKGEELVIIPALIQNTTTDKLGIVSYNLGKLQDALEDGKLSGRLKELVSSLDEDANDVIMLLHFK